MAPPGTDRRGLLTGGASLLAAAALPHWADAQSTVSPPDYAVFTEFSPGTKQAKGGWNRRIFTDTDSRRGTAIQCDFATGIVTLAPGTYRISGFSMVTYESGSEPETTTIRAPASAGYCRLRTFNPALDVDPLEMRALDNADPSVICIGSASTANLVPSLFDAVYETEKPSPILLEHQSGSKPEQIYLRIFTQESKWHAFARISIRRL
jgi:hypothetical protein